MDCCNGKSPCSSLQVGLFQLCVFCLLAWWGIFLIALFLGSSLQSSLSLGHLPRLFSVTMSCLLSSHTQVVSAATQTLKVCHMLSISSVISQKWICLSVFLFFSLPPDSDKWVCRCANGRDWTCSKNTSTGNGACILKMFQWAYMWTPSILKSCPFLEPGLSKNLTSCLFQYCGGRVVLSFSCLLAVCAADPGLLLPSCRKTGSSFHDKGILEERRK